MTRTFDEKTLERMQDRLAEFLTGDMYDEFVDEVANAEGFSANPVTDEEVNRNAELLDEYTAEAVLRMYAGLARNLPSK